MQPGRKSNWFQFICPLLRCYIQFCHSALSITSRMSLSNSIQSLEVCILLELGQRKLVHMSSVSLDNMSRGKINEYVYYADEICGACILLYPGVCLITIKLPIGLVVMNTKK